MTGCGGGGSGDRVSKAKGAFAAKGVPLHEVDGMFGQGNDIQLAPDSRARYGDFVVHVMKSEDGFRSAEETAGRPDAAGIRWDDTLANHNPPYFTALKRFGSDLELQWSSERRSVDQPQWRALDTIVSGLR
jgi:hypothetical protein